MHGLGFHKREANFWNERQHSRCLLARVSS